MFKLSASVEVVSTFLTHIGYRLDVKATLYCVSITLKFKCC